MKVCRDCGRSLPRSEFYKDTKTRDGLRTRCKACWGKACAVSRNRSEESRERARATVRRYRARNRKRFAELNRVQSRRWYAEHPEWVKAYVQRWKRDNPDKTRGHRAEYRHRRRARIHGTQTEPVDRLAIFERDKGICHLCERPVSRRSFTLDHLVPLSRGGPHSPENVAVAHYRCNVRRGVRPLPALATRS